MGNSTIQNLGSRKKGAFLDFFFPAYCAYCDEQTHLRYLCKSCWQESSPIDPSHRCRVCFREIDAPSICARCAKTRTPFERAALFEQEAPILSILYREESIEAAAGFILYQLLSLNWDLPTLIAPLPNQRHPIAAYLAFMLCIPCQKIFRRRIFPLGRERFEITTDLIHEDSVVLLLDFGTTREQRKEAKRALASVFPRKGYVLSIVDN